MPLVQELEEEIHEEVWEKTIVSQFDPHRVP